MPQTPPSRPRSSNVYAMPNPEERGGSNIKAIIVTAALTALVGVATVGAATGIWRAATRRAGRLLKRQEAEQLAGAPPPGPYVHNGYLVWPQQSVMPPPPTRNSMPDALRDIPPLVNPPIMQPMAPTPVVVAPSPEIVAEIRKMGSSFDRRFTGLERRLDEFESADDDEDEEYDEGDDEEDVEDEPEPPPQKGKRRR